MQLSEEEITIAALNLPTHAKESLIQKLTLSIGSYDQEVEEAWLDVAESRIEAYEAGRTTAKPAFEALQNIRQKWA